MTCIVGIEDGGTVWMGGDSLLSNSEVDFCITCVGKKVLQVGEFLLAHCGEVRFSQVLEYHFDLFRDKDDDLLDDMAYMVKVFVPYIQELFRKHNILREEADGTTLGYTFMVGHRGKLFGIQNDWVVLRTDFGYLSYGSGVQYAMGSLHTTDNLGIRVDSDVRVKMALEAACKFTGSVRAPFTILSL